MTTAQKDQIARMRDNGADYGMIATTLGIDKNTIRVHCQRHGLVARPVRTVLPLIPISTSDEQPKPTFGACAQCGRPLTSNHQRRFCSIACRTIWWNHHPDHTNRRAYYVCQQCGKRFFSYVPRKYCSHQCYVNTRFGKAGDAI